LTEEAQASVCILSVAEKMNYYGFLRISFILKNYGGTSRDSRPAAARGGSRKLSRLKSNPAVQ
jgi:hypothetical protein